MKGNTMRDFRQVKYGDGNAEGWSAMIAAMNSGEETQIHDSIYWYFLEVLPPKWHNHGGFVFAEGADPPTLFSGLGEKTRRMRQFPTWEALRDHFRAYGVSPQDLPRARGYCF